MAGMFGGKKSYKQAPRAAVSGQRNVRARTVARTRVRSRREINLNDPTGPTDPNDPTGPNDLNGPTGPTDPNGPHDPHGPNGPNN